MSIGLDPDQDLHLVNPDLCPNCLQRLSAEDKSPLVRKELVNARGCEKTLMYMLNETESVVFKFCRLPIVWKDLFFQIIKQNLKYMSI